MPVPRSIMEDRVRFGLKQQTPTAYEYRSVSSDELQRRKQLISVELDSLGKHIRDIEEHLKRIREYQSALFTQKDAIERKLTPILIVKPARKPKPKTIEQIILERYSITELEVILNNMQTEGLLSSLNCIVSRCG